MDMRDPTEKSILLSDVADNLESIGVPLPPIPQALSEQLLPLSEQAFGSIPTETPLYNLDAFLEQLTPNWPLDYMIFGVSGRGMNSYGVHYYLVTEHCALFIQRSTPVLSENTFQPDAFAGLMTLASELSCHPALDNDDGKLVVVDSDLLYSRIGQWRAGELVWSQDVTNAIEQAFNSL